MKQNIQTKSTNSNITNKHKTQETIKIHNLTKLPIKTQTNKLLTKVKFAPRINTKKTHSKLNNTPIKTQTNKIQTNTFTKHDKSNKQTNKTNFKVPNILDTLTKSGTLTLKHNKTGSASRPRDKTKRKYLPQYKLTSNIILTPITKNNTNTFSLITKLEKIPLYLTSLHTKNIESI